MDISILLSTYKRYDILKQTMESFCELDTQGIQWEILVADNGDDAQTKRLIKNYEDKLPVKYFVENRLGKNFALNSLLCEGKGTLIIFTDDDVVVDPSWLKEILEGAKRWPKNDVFGGRILPKWPNVSKPLSGIEKGFFASAYCIADWEIEEGPYEPSKVWGPNMAIRKNIFEKGWKFNESIGPQGKNYMMGSETDLTKRLQEKGFIPIYLPKALVKHQVRAEQLSAQWLYQRAYRRGRQKYFCDQKTTFPTLLGIPRYLLPIILKIFIQRLFAFFSFNRARFINLGIQYWKIKGSIYQFQQTKIV